MPDFVTASRSVIACDLGYAVVVVNYATGKIRTLIGASGRWWRELADTGELVTTTALPQQVAEYLAEQLCAEGTLYPITRPRPWPAPEPSPPWRPNWGTSEIPFALEPPPPIPAPWLSAAGCALAFTLAHQHAGPRHRRMARMIQLANALTTRPHPPASAETVLRAVQAIRRVSLFSPVRSACLEESVATVALLTSMGQGVRWCHGLFADPITIHAWVETLDGEAPAEAAPERYARLYSTPTRPKDFA